MKHFLSQPHLETLLKESGISQEIIEARGYYTIFKKTEAKNLGFSKSQTDVVSKETPALVIPCYNTAGNLAFYQLRPDYSRWSESKPIKYEQPAGKNLELVVHPSFRHYLYDPDGPLFITEGVKKADSLHSHGAKAVIALLGVNMFRGTNPLGGKTTYPGWENVALNGRVIYIVFDSDIMTKPQVHKALMKLYNWLVQQHGAKVNIIYLPPKEDGSKQGIDDYLAAGNSLESATLLAEERPLTIQVTAEKELVVGNYVEKDNCIYQRIEKGDHIVDIPLTNFRARIVEEIIFDDGAEQTRKIRLEGQTASGRHLPQVQINAHDFPGLKFIEPWGTQAIVTAGQATKDKVREAIQKFSHLEGVEETFEYGHLGFRSIGDNWNYLHASGAITKDGQTDNIKAKVEGSLQNYNLNYDSSNENIAIAKSFSIIDLAPLKASIILLLAAYRAPFYQADFSIGLFGESGTRKSSIAAVLQSHFGATMVDGRSFPADWSATENSLEVLAFLAKDALLVIDDFAPQGDKAREYQKKAGRILRAQGNNSGRSRLRSDGSLRPTRAPRGLILITGEDIPNGQSIRARLLILELTKSDLNLSILTQLQKAGTDGILSQAMASYINWLCNYLDIIRNLLKRSHAYYRRFFSGAHGRTAETCSELMFTFDVLEKFANHKGIKLPITRQQVFDALRVVARNQTSLQSDQNEVYKVKGYLPALFISGRAHVTSGEGEAPIRAMEFGWQVKHLGEEEVFYPLGEKIGYLDRGEIMLNPQSTYAALQKLARDSGDLISTNPKTLWKRLVEAGIVLKEEEGKSTAKRSVDSERKRYLIIKLDIYDREIGAMGALDSLKFDMGKIQCPPSLFEAKEFRAIKEPTLETLNAPGNVIVTESDTDLSLAQLHTAPIAPIFEEGKAESIEEIPSASKAEDFLESSPSSAKINLKENEVVI